MTEAYLQALIGTQLEVLFEEPEGELFTGHAPNYVKVYTQGEDLHNQIHTVKITGIHADGVIGRIM